MSEQKDFELNPLWEREPVEVPEDRGDVVTGAGEGEQQNSGCTGVYLGPWMMCLQLQSILDVMRAWIKVSAGERESVGGDNSSGHMTDVMFAG